MRHEPTLRQIQPEGKIVVVYGPQSKGPGPFAIDDGRRRGDGGIAEQRSVVQPRRDVDKVAQLGAIAVDAPVACVAECGANSAHEGQLPRELARQPIVIAVEKGNEPAVGCVESTLSGLRGPAVLLPDQLD